MACEARDVWAVHHRQQSAGDGRAARRHTAACFPPWPPPSASLRHITRRIYDASRQDSLPCLKPSLVVWWLAHRFSHQRRGFFHVEHRYLDAVDQTGSDITMAGEWLYGADIGATGISPAVWHDGYTRRARPWCAASASGACGRGCYEDFRRIKP